MRTKNQLYKNPNFALLEASHYLCTCWSQTNNNIAPILYRRDDFSIEGFVAESEKLESQLRPYTNDSFDYKFIGCNSDAADGAVAGGYPCALWQLG